jgi:hypothetical protein
MIEDFNGEALKQDTYGTVWLEPEEYFKPSDKADVESYSQYILWCVGGAVIFWLTIAIATDKTVMPVFLLVLGMQQYFYISC